MTAAIAIETSKSDLPLAIGLGIVPNFIVIFINALASSARRARELYAGWACARALDLPVRLDNVCVLAGAVAILDGATTTLAPGVPIMLIGSTGAGKTALLRVAMRLIRSTGGDISWGGRN